MIRILIQSKFSLEQLQNFLANEFENLDKVNGSCVIDIGTYIDETYIKSFFNLYYMITITKIGKMISVGQNIQ